ncbi:MAG: aminotransferase class I/II-fold pyridoxal phosphate-dependent enzyme [Bacteroidales bacterium]|jgi:O-succinylhomoserine sulfhydrylase|nr:aminotransferase class I/II-fold pyridoxal phosphate-dependent enzyme [Bacteroidales bacterium]
MNEEEKQFETQAIRTQTERTQYNEHSTPLFLTSSFVFDDSEEMRAVFADEITKHAYSRYTNPNINEFAEKMAKLEQTEAGYAYASGMGAVFSTMMALLNSGEHIISCSSIYGATHVLFSSTLPRWNIHTSFFDIRYPEMIEKLIQPNTKILYAESPTNPACDVIDLELLAEIAHKHNLLFIVDNCFATPYLQTPITLGADIVLHSATKLIDGQGRVLGGVVVGNMEIMNKIYLFSRGIGATLSPFNAWILSKSLETLAIRVERHCENALKLAEFLEQHHEVVSVKYPFLQSSPQYQLAKKQMKMGGNIVAFEIKGGLEAGKKFQDSLKMCSMTSNLGDSRTIVTHPASTTHSKLSKDELATSFITEGMIRVSVGLEHIDDIIADIKQALEKRYVE